MSQTEIELRAFDFQLDIEARGKDKPEIVGHAAVFNKYTDIMWFQERVMPGAFSETIKNDDVKFLFNHNPDNILARRFNNTLELSEDDKGLFIRAYPADTTLGRDLLKLIERGDISQMSFAFRVSKDGDIWHEGKNGEPDKRDLLKLKVFDVSAVTHPAYKDTDISLRSYEEWRKKIEEIQDIVSPPMDTWRTGLLRKKLNLKKRRNIDE